VEFSSQLVSNELRGRGSRVTSFQWWSDGGWAVLRFGSPHVEEVWQATAHGAATPAGWVVAAQA
jgi:hypothetical protein